MATDHEVLLGALLSQLSSNQASVRKRTISCTGKVEDAVYNIFDLCSYFSLMLRLCVYVCGCMRRQWLCIDMHVK